MAHIGGGPLVLCAVLTLAASARADEPSATSERTIGVPVRRVRPHLADPRWWPFGDPVHASRVTEYRSDLLVASDPRGATLSVSLRELVPDTTTVARCTVSLPEESDDTPSRRFARSWEVAATACDRLAAKLATPRIVGTKGYGVEIVIADLVALATLGIGAPFAGPIVHLVHDRPRRALGSFALRFGSITVTTALALGIALLLPPANYTYSAAWCGPITGTGNCPPDPNYIPQALVSLPIGGAVGWLVASAIDAAFIARPGYAAPRER